MGLLSGLGKIGLKNLEGLDVYEQPEEKKAAAAEVKEKKPEFNEEEVLFDKKYECPVCYTEFKEKTVRAGKVRLVKTDTDLRPVYEHMEPLKYNVVMCPYCGHAALTQYFGKLTSVQSKLIKENISENYEPNVLGGATYSYEMALERFQLCLANTIVKKGKASEKAYVCLKTAWLLRSMEENMDPSEADYAQKMAECKEQEQEFLKNAMEGFVAARQSESFPICGMDETTLDYLVAVLSMKFEKYDVTSRLIASILGSPSANTRMKDKARDLKEELLVKMKEKKAGK